MRRTALCGSAPRARRALVGLDHVVGWSTDLGEVGAAGGVSNTGEGKKVGHRSDSFGDGAGFSHTGPPEPGARRPSGGDLRRTPMQSAYDAYQEGNRLLASQNPHAAAVALERARELEPDKGSVRETLAARTTGAAASRRRGRSSSVRSRSSRSTTTPTSASACASCARATGSALAGTSSWRWPCGPTTSTTATRSPGWPRRVTETTNRR